MLGATPRAVAVGVAASGLDGARADPQDRTEQIAFNAGAGDVGTTLDEARSRLAALDPAATARSWLVALGDPGSPLEVWIALGPPACSVLVRCWPGLVQGPDAAGEDRAPAALALATDAFCGAVAAGRIPAARVDAILAAAQGTAIAEGLLAERHARLMDAAGDDRGGAVRRLVAQAYAVDVALAAFREAVGALA